MQPAGRCVLFALILLVASSTWIVAFPRDSSVFLTEECRPINENDGTLLTSEKKPAPVTEPSPVEKSVPNEEVHIPGVVVACQFEEATEDPVCQEHCLPKGYSYGLCVSNKCSCV